MKKKLVVIGKGTAGCFAMTHFLKWTNWDIDWYYDDNIKPQAVGEGSNIAFPKALFQNIGFQHYDLDEIDGTFKLGIKKTGWAKGKDYIHTFIPPFVSYHFNATRLQNYLFSMFKDNPRVTYYNKKVTNYDDIDCDFIMDCSGRPEDLSLFEISNSIPVNSVHVTQCYWDKVEFQHTLTLARPYGWVFGIPLKNRCSIGYLYNNEINSLDEVKEDVKNVFEEYNLTPSTDHNTFTFGNYYRKKNFDGRVAYNGNASFFLEPLEATSIHMMDNIQRLALVNWTSPNSLNVNLEYTKSIKEIETMIMLHYYSGSIYNTKFWDVAKEKGEKNVVEALNTDKKLNEIIEASKYYKFGDEMYVDDYGTWNVSSFKQNLENLDYIIS